MGKMITKPQVCGVRYVQIKQKLAINHPFCGETGIHNNKPSLSISQQDCTQFQKARPSRMAEWHCGSRIRNILVNWNIITGWWLTYPSEK